MATTHTLVMVRHGESTWNQENRFTGWTDVELTELGMQQARQAGRDLKAAGYGFDLAMTSVLRRAIRTLWLMQEELDMMWLPVVHAWRLNERHYGGLQGLNKADMAKRYGDEQVLRWRRSFDIAPPPLGQEDWAHMRQDPRYARLSDAETPHSESLKDTIARVLPFWRESMAPALQHGRRLLVAAHGNSMRALVKYLENVSDDDIVGVNIPNGKPLIYTFDASLRPIRRQYLGEDAVELA